MGIHSHIEQLIHDMCPSGVKTMTLKDVARSIRTGLNPRENFVLNEEGADLYYVTVKEFVTGKILFSDKTDRITEAARVRIQERSQLEVDDILFSGIGTIGKVAIVDIPVNNWNCSESVFLIKPNKNIVLPKYLMYYLGSTQCKEQYETLSVGSTLKGVRKGVLESIIIPLPAISIQEVIVRILDVFTKLIGNIEDELDVRLTQYNIARKIFLDNNLPTVALKDICENCDNKRKPITAGKRTAGNIPYYGASGIVDYVEGYIYDGDYLLISEDGANLLARNTPIAFPITGKTWVNNHAHVLKFKNKCTQKFVESFINFSDLEQYISSGAQPKLSQANLNRIQIPLPPIAEQRAIAEKLDTIEAFINNLKTERDLRQQQYEYYREYLINLLK